MQQIHVHLRLDPDIERAVTGEELNQRLLRNPRTVNQLGGGHISKSDPVVDCRSAVPCHLADCVQGQRIGIGSVEVFEVPDELCAIRFRQLDTNSILKAFNNPLSGSDTLHKAMS